MLQPARCLGIVSLVALVTLASGCATPPTIGEIEASLMRSARVKRRGPALRVVPVHGGDMDANLIASDESGDISSAPAPRKGATDKGGYEQWRFADNSVNSVAMRRPTNPVGYAAT